MWTTLRVAAQAHRPYDENHPDSLTHLTGRIRAETIMQLVRIALNRIREHEVQPSGSLSLPLAE
jgi:hypothetical protein